MKYFLSGVVAMFFGVCVFAQSNLLSIDDAVIGVYRKMYASQLTDVQWKGNSTCFTYFKKGALYQQTVKKDKEEAVFSSNELFSITHDSAFFDLMMFSYSWENENVIWITNENKMAKIDLHSKKLLTYLTLPDSAENIDVCFQSNCAAYTIKNNLWIQDITHKSYPISTESNTGIVYGKSVHRNEFGIEKGTYWSNTGKYLAFYRMDESMVTEYPIVDISTRIAELKPMRYPMAGMKSHEVTVGVFNLETKKMVYLNTGEPKEQFLTNIAWSSDDNYIFIAVLNREQNFMKLNMYNAHTGAFVKTLFEEKNDRYVEPLHPLVFISNDQFIWQSQRDGFNHLYLYKMDGTLIKQITKGNWVVTDYLGYDKNTHSVFFVSTNPNALERQVYKVNISNNAMQRLTSEEGTHTPVFNKDFSMFIDSYSNINTPLIMSVQDANGNRIRTFFKSENVLAKYDMPSLSFVTVKSADGKTDMYGRIIKPLHFDSTKKYPLILYVYGGPHAQLVQNEWLGGAAMWDYYMAQQGYIVATVDNRGSSNRGFDFESCIHRQVGINEANDQMEFVKYLEKKGCVDENRIGIHGWSFGGFMTINLMTTFPDVFKVGVAGGPVTDWKYYEVMYGERYMDMPQENPDGYEKTSLLNKAQNLKGKLLIIHGYIDDTVVLQNSLAFIQKCIEKKVQVDYFLYPQHLHNVRGKDRIHLMKKVTQYFNDYLK